MTPIPLIRLSRRARARLVAALAALAISSSGMAATITWQHQNAAGSNWNNNKNWSGNVPGSGDIARFNANTTDDPVINANFTVGQLLFTGSTDAEAFTGTNTLTLAGISGVGIDNESSQDHTFANRFAITSAQVWRNTNATSGSLTFNNTINLNANTLTLTNTNSVNSMLFGTSAVISGTGALSIGGAGSVTLSGANTYSGGTTLSAGTLTVASNTALGTGALAITGVGTLSASGSRSLSNTINASSDFTIGGTDNLTLTGPINLGSGNRVLTVNNTGTTTFSGVVDNAYYANFTKAGNGRLVLSGNNTFDGSFLLNAGTVALQHSNALGSSTYGNVIANGATLEFSNNITVAEGAFTLTGAGQGGSVGAIHNLSGDNSLSAQLTLGGATTITASAGSLTMNGQVAIGGNTFTVGGAGDLAFTSQINGSGTLSKIGSGTLTLSGANSYTGATNINAGTLRLSGGNERIADSSNVSVSSGATFDINGVTETIGSLAGSGNVTLGTGTLRTNANNSSTTFSGVISGAGNFEKIGSGILTLSGANTYTGETNISGGTLTLGASERLANTTAVNVTAGATFNLAGFTETVGSIAGNANIALGSGSLLAGGNNTSTVFSGVISGSGGALTKQGTGTLTLSGTNTYTGLTSVSNGTLLIQSSSALGTSAGGTTVSDGATLALQGGITVNDETLTLTGAGSSGAGALRNVADTNTWNGNVTLAGDTTIVSAGGLLNIGGSAISGIDTFSVGANQLIFSTAGGNIDIRSGLTGSGAGTITKDGSGTLTLSGANNTFSGAYQINDGQVTLATPTYLGSYVNKGIQGDVTIGDGTGAAGSASLVMSTMVPGNNRIADTVNIRVNSDGLFNLAGRSDKIAALTIQGGDVMTGVGTLDLGGDVAFLGSGREATISGYLGLGGVVRTIDVASGTSAHISATINSGGYIKTGDGTLIVSANDASTYAGTTTINGGVLNVRGNLALGQGNSSAYGSRTEVNAGALELQNNVNIAGEYLQLGSTGIGGAGGLRSVSGDNVWSGSIALDGNSRINTDSGSTLLLDGVTLSMDTFGLTVGGAGNTTISKDISSDIGSSSALIKDGTGTLFLSGNSTYRGETQITNGIVNIASGDALGSTAGDTVVSSGATLQLQGNISSGEAVSISGSGFAGTSGVIQNVSGSNTLAGGITMTGASRIASDSGTLTLSGGITGSGQALTVAGGGSTTISGAIATGTGTVTKEGSGTLTLSGINSYTGTTQVNAGTLAFGAGNALGTSNLVATASGAIVDLNGFNQSIGSISGTGIIDFSGATLTLNGASTFAGVFDGSGTLVLNAGASLTLGADFSNSDLNIVLNGGSLFLNNTSNTFGSLTVTAASILDFGSGASVVQFSSVTANAKLSVNNWVETVDYFYSTANAGIQGQSPLNNIVFAGWTGDNTTWQPHDSGPYNDNEITPVPEPEVYGAAFVSGLLALVAWRRRRAAVAKN